jgi:hypothetical protein
MALAMRDNSKWARGRQDQPVLLPNAELAEIDPQKLHGYLSLRRIRLAVSRLGFSRRWVTPLSVGRNWKPISGSNISYKTQNRASRCRKGKSLRFGLF